MASKEDPDKAATVIYEKEDKIATFNGSNIEYETWHKDATKSIKGLSDSRALRLIVKSLHGVAKAEAELREETEGEFKTAVEVFDHLEKIFGDKRSKTKRLAQFHDRTQGETEDIMSFSQDLVRLSTSLDDRQNKLKEQFAENVYNKSLCWELKKVVIADTTLNFQKLREIALSWEETNGKPNPVRKNRVGHDVQAVEESQLTKIGKQIELLTDRMSTLEARMNSLLDNRNQNQRDNWNQRDYRWGQRDNGYQHNWNQRGYRGYRGKSRYAPRGNSFRTDNDQQVQGPVQHQPLQESAPVLNPTAGVFTPEIVQPPHQGNGHQPRK